MIFGECEKLAKPNGRRKKCAAGSRPAVRV
jgi:hypothetical protein